MNRSMKGTWRRWKVDKKRILSFLDSVETYVQELEKHLPSSLSEYKKSLEKQRFCERTLQLLIEVCIDTANLLVKELKLGLPEEEDTVFEKIKDKEIISEEMYGKLKEMKKFRNILIHRYKTIDNSIVYHHAAEERSDFTEFKKEILSFLKEYEEKKKTKKN